MRFGSEIIFLPDDVAQIEVDPIRALGYVICVMREF
ncbi:MAG: hypothetical protein ACI9PX_000978 [Reinekea sp.]|jgi:hypothetical protein